MPRHRKVANPWPHLAAAVDAEPPPGRQRTIVDDLLAEGVPAASVGRVQALVYREGARLAAEGFRHVVACLENTPAGTALKRALCGSEGRSLEDDAALAGCDRNNLARAVARIERRLTPLQKMAGPQAAQSMEPFT